MFPNTSGKSPVGKGSPSWPGVGPVTLLGVGVRRRSGPQGDEPRGGLSSLAALVRWALQLFVGGCLCIIGPLTVPRPLSTGWQGSPPSTRQITEKYLQILPDVPQWAKSPPWRTSSLEGE